MDNKCPTCGHNRDGSCHACEDVQVFVKELMKVIEFYGDSENWWWQTDGDKDLHDDFYYKQNERFGGRRAREIMQSEQWKEYKE